MWRRITDLWPNLIARPNEIQDADENQPLLNPEEQEELERTTLEVYRNQHWTRVIRVDDFAGEDSE